MRTYPASFAGQVIAATVLNVGRQVNVLQF